MENSEEQKEELYSVESIFNVYEKNLTFEDRNLPCGHFKANVRLPETFNVTFIRSVENDGAVAEAAASLIPEKFEVQHLPPINIFFELPKTYPSDSWPAFLLSCNWLTLQQISKLCRHLESMWDTGMPILFTWFHFLENEVLEFLNFQSLDITELLSYKINHSLMQPSVDNAEEAASKLSFNIKPSIEGGNKSIDCRAFNDLNDGRSLIQLLKNFNEFKILDVFNRKYHECNICLTSKSGNEFVIFRNCNHAFCRECIKGFFEVQIREGNVNCLTCPTEKCTSQADGSMVLQIVDKDLFERYDNLLLTRTLESMEDIDYCPRKWCQCAAIIDIKERIGSCPSCSFVFCPFCKMAYHGIAPCVLKAKETQAILQQYLTGDKATKEMLEKRHGKRAIRYVVEETLTADWKLLNSKDCPHCKVTIQKNDGCNKMTCFKCGTFFCWICMKLLDQTNPYRHFSNNDCELFPFDLLENAFDINPGDFLDY